MHLQGSCCPPSENKSWSKDKCKEKLPEIDIRCTSIAAPVEPVKVILTNSEKKSRNDCVPSDITSFKNERVLQNSLSSTEADVELEVKPGLKWKRKNDHSTYEESEVYCIMFMTSSNRFEGIDHGIDNVFKE